MFGYMDRRKAKAVGFTHQGKYYGIPLWITVSQRPTIAAKWYPMEFIVSVLQRTDIFIKTKLLCGRKHLHQLTHIEAI